MTNDLHDAAAASKPADSPSLEALRERVPRRQKALILKASDIADACAVDITTVHNWVDRGRLSAFRSPGGHLRFKIADVAAFLTTHGYPLPDELQRLVDEGTIFLGVPPAPRALTEREMAVARWQAAEEARPHLWIRLTDREMAVARWQELSDADRDVARDALMSYASRGTPIGVALALLNALEPEKGGS